MLYTPDKDEDEDDSFEYTVSDGEYSDTAEVTILINPINDPPDVPPFSDSIVIQPNVWTPLLVLKDASDVEGQSLEVVGFPQLPNLGEVRIPAGGSFVEYRCLGGCLEADGFTFTVRDSGGEETVAGATLFFIPQFGADPEAATESEGGSDE